LERSEQMRNWTDDDIGCKGCRRKGLATKLPPTAPGTLAPGSA